MGDHENELDNIHEHHGNNEARRMLLIEIWMCCLGSQRRQGRVALARPGEGAASRPSEEKVCEGLVPTRKDFSTVLLEAVEDHCPAASTSAVMN